jgi:hypothetical protein
VPSIASVRAQYLAAICSQLVYLADGVPNFADISSETSRAISRLLAPKLGEHFSPTDHAGQKKGRLFESITRDFIESAFSLLGHMRPGPWQCLLGSEISRFEQYAHLSNLTEAAAKYPEVAIHLEGMYVIKPDIVIARVPWQDAEINASQSIVSDDGLVRLAPLRARNQDSPKPLLHASILCKWTLRSDRAQNVRSEALNLIRSRKGSAPHTVAVVAEPLPTRIASIALGTGDLDCVYHFALYELLEAVKESNLADQVEMLAMLVDGRRLRDISDLPMDLAI